jgi:hypothetical protein
MTYEWGKDPVNDAVALLAKLYYFMGKEMLDSFGDEGEQALRRSVRNFGVSRGEALRDRHQEAGLPIDVRSLFENYDLPYGKDHYQVRKIIQFDEDHRVSETMICHLQEIWHELGGEEGKQIGAIYCDEFHQAMWGAYDNDITVDLPSLLSKNDPCCRFEVHREKND